MTRPGGKIGFFDRGAQEDSAEEDLWFLPGPPEDAAPTDMPGPNASRGKLFNPQLWALAEREAGRGLSAAAMAFARLDEAILQQPQTIRDGMIRRLAISEVSALSWADQVRLEPERLALYLHLRLSSGEDAQELSTADWAVRRLCGSITPAEGVARFLGRDNPEGKTNAYQGVRAEEQIDDATSPEHLGLFGRPQGEEFAALAGDWQTVLVENREAHPLTKTALGFFAWGALGLSGEEFYTEAAVAAAKGAGEMTRGRSTRPGLPFVPLTLGSNRSWVFGGTPLDRLSRWFAAVESACLQGLLILDRLKDWRERAIANTQDMSGRTPPELLQALMATPVICVEIAAHMVGCSKAAALRNLNAFETRGLIREITGQGRYRFWAAKV